LILLVEGLLEEIVYSGMLEKLYAGKQVECESIQRPLREFIEPVMRRTKCYTLERGDLVITAFLTSDPNMIERRAGRGRWEPL